MNEIERQAVLDLRRNLLRLTNAIEAEGKQVDANAPVAGGDQTANLSPRQIASASATIAIVDDLGQYDQSTGPDGACYWDDSDNQQQADGIMCQNCIFFQDPNGDPTDGDETCMVVSGQIDAGGLCKLWIIPSEELGAGEATETAEE
jgi:hypothetical protein